MRTEIPTGWTNRVIKIATENGDFIFRFPRTPFWEEVLVTEYEKTKFISRYIKTVKQRLLRMNGHPYSVHKYIDGEPLSSAFPKMTEKQKRNIAGEIIKYLSRLQSIPAVGLEKLSSFLARLAKSTGNKSYDYSTLAALRDRERNGKSVLVHGDFNADNILVRDNKLALVIDYAFASASSKDADLARICNRLPEIKKYVGSVDKDLIAMWDYVDANYIAYMNRQET
jgi:aminoglycoside phosphotransferase (APT) family kinase protein